MPPLAALVVGVDEPDGPLRRIGRRHQIAQRIDGLLELIARNAAKGSALHRDRRGLVLELGQLLG